MKNLPTSVDRGTLIISGFDGLNLFDYIEADIPVGRWPARIRIDGVMSSGIVSAKIQYIDIDGTDADVVNEYLENNKELSVTEVDCKIDLVKLLAAAKQLDIVLPNTARLTRDHHIAAQG
jgi:hypothetical protein